MPIDFCMFYYYYRTGMLILLFLTLLPHITYVCALTVQEAVDKYRPPTPEELCMQMFERSIGDCIRAMTYAESMIKCGVSFFGRTRSGDRKVLGPCVEQDDPSVFYKVIGRLRKGGFGIRFENMQNPQDNMYEPVIYNGFIVNTNVYVFIPVYAAKE
jgi:hypothetical protein